MYAVETNLERREALAEIGTALRKAGEQARRLPTDSLGAKAAFRRAEEATGRLCVVVVSGDVERVVRGSGGAGAARLKSLVMID